MFFGRVVLLSIVDGTVEWSCESLEDIVPDVGEVRTKGRKSRRWLKSFCILLRWLLRLDRREDETAVKNRLS